MKVIRRKVFETNSSSSHSISIEQLKEPKVNNIEEGTTIKVKGFDYLSGGDENYVSATYISEVGKLNFLVNIIATILDEQVNGVSFEDMIKLNPFTWLKEVVLTERNATLEYEKQDSYYPYFDTKYSEDGDIKDMFGLNINDEETFKDRVKEIIFNKNIIIKEESIPYGMEDGNLTNY